MRVPCTCFSVLIVALLIIPGGAQAANIHIDDTSPTGSITITWVDFEFGFTVNGTFFAPVPLGFPQSVTFTPTLATPLTFSGDWITFSGTGGASTLCFVDPGTNHVRDSLFASFEPATSSAHVFGSFSSDVPTDLGDLGTSCTGTPVQVTGTSQELVGTYLTAIPGNITFQVVAKLVAAPPPLGSTGTTSNPSGGTLETVNQTVTQAVNTATGNTYIKFSDLVVPGKAPRFAFIRSYNDQDTYSGPLCRGWTHSYNILLTVDAISGAVTIKEGDGHQNVFQPGATPGSFTAPSGVFDVLAKTGLNTFTLTRPNQTVLAFGPIPLNPLLIRLLSITDKDGNTQTLSYDALGNLTSFTDIGGGVFQFTYDINNHLILLHDVALNRNFTYACDATNLKTYTDALTRTSNYNYDSNNLLTVATDARTNSAINNTFDTQRRVTQTTRGTGAFACPTTYSYDDVNHITTITDPRGAVTKHYYDGSKRLIKIVNALSFQTTFTYDSNNNVLSVTNPLGRTTSYTYDGHGNRTSVTDPLGNATQFVYDSKNNLTGETDANLNSTAFAYDVFGNLIKVTDALAGITNYTYDARGNKITFKNAKGNTNAYSFDLGNHLLSSTDPALKTTVYTYDSGGRLVTQTEPAGNKKTLAYDSLGRLTSVSYTTGASGLASAGPVSYLYDPNGNRTRMTDPTGVTNYARDPLNRITSITFPGSRVVAYTYDCNDNRTSITYAGKTVNYTYDALNRLTSVKDGTKVTTYTYDADDNPISITYPNSAGVGYSYDAADRVTQVQNTYTGSDAGPVSNFTYLLDNIGTRVQVTNGPGTVSTYSYDKLYRLTGSTVALKTNNFSYDGVGNRLTQTGPSLSNGYIYDAADKLISAGQAAFLYDSNGNQVKQTTGKTTIIYAYDAADRLISVTNGASVTKFTYDGDGNRVTQKVGNNAYTYLNDIATGFATVLDETGPDGHIQYVRGRGLVSANGPTFTYYYHYDSQSTVVGVSDATGHLAQRYVYDVWGQQQLTVPNPGIGTQNKFGYTGEALDPGTGLIYLRARYYDPTLGRFISKDPIAGYERSPQTLNRFVYVRNNPATLTDRTGLCDDTGYCDVGDFFSEALWPGAPELP